ncbi:MAG: tetratricopeptide repeat protein, partial [Thermoanaerobaculia bacterium]
MAVQRDKVLANAEKLVAKGKIEPAIKEYERLLEDNPNDVNTLNRIGDLWVRINRTDEAVKVFSKIADHYGKDGFFLKAIAIFKKINKLDPSKLDVYAKLADLYAKQGLAMEAKSQYQVLADYYIKHGEPGNALTIYKKISDLDPNSINVHVKLADLYSQNNQVADALKEYDRVGRLLLKRGMLDEAMQVFKKALKIDPKNVELVESLVTALLENKDYNNAAGVVQAALDGNRDDVRLLSTMGRIQLARGDVAGAQEA